MMGENKENAVKVRKNSQKVYDGLKITFDISVKDMTDFMIFHTYSRIQGWFGLAVSVFALGYLIFNFNNMETDRKLLLLILGLLFTVINPVVLRIKAKKQVESNPSFKVPITYTLAEEGIVVEQKNIQEVHPWKNVVIVKDSKRSIIVYVSRVRAFIWPKEKYADSYDQVTETLMEKLGRDHVFIKKK